MPPIQLPAPGNIPMTQIQESANIPDFRPALQHIPTDSSYFALSSPALLSIVATFVCQPRDLETYLCLTPLTLCDNRPHRRKYAPLLPNSTLNTWVPGPVTRSETLALHRERRRQKSSVL